MAFSMTLFITDPIIPQMPEILHSFLVETHCSHHHVCTCATNFSYTTWVWAVAYQKQLLGQNLWGSGLNLGPPIYFCNR